MSTNETKLQDRIDARSGIETPSSIKLFGIQWDRLDDSISTGPLELNPQATTKRSMLSSLNSIYDVFGITKPLFGRASLFVHKLQKIF